MKKNSAGAGILCREGVGGGEGPLSQQKNKRREKEKK